MKAYYSDRARIPLPEGHRFPAGKYALLRSRLEEEFAGNGLELLAADPASEAELTLAHDPDYVSKVFNGCLTDREMRRIGFPWSPALVDRSRRSVGGTIGAGRVALAEGVGVNLSGGTHHAFHNHGEGFCVFNDVAVAIRVLFNARAAERVLIVDGDVHQGNGTADILRGEPGVFTFSIHGARNFPFRKVAGDLDIPLPDGTGDEEFLEAFRRGVQGGLEKFPPDVVFYIAGADPHEGDRLGRLSLTKSGLAARDRYLFDVCRKHQLPVAVVMGGGYGRRIEDTVDIHFETVRQALEHSKRIR